MFQHLEDFPLSSSVFSVSEIHCHSLCFPFEGMFSPRVTAVCFSVLLFFNSFLYSSLRIVFFVFILPGNSQSFLIPVIIYFVSTISLYFIETEYLVTVFIFNFLHFSLCLLAHFYQGFLFVCLFLVSGSPVILVLSSVYPSYFLVIWCCLLA